MPLARSFPVTHSWVPSTHTETGEVTWSSAELGCGECVSPSACPCIVHFYGDEFIHSQQHSRVGTFCCPLFGDDIRCREMKKHVQGRTVSNRQNRDSAPVRLIQKPLLPATGIPASCLTSGRTQWPRHRVAFHNGRGACISFLGPR